MSIGVYKIENKVNNKVYIGSSIDLDSRKYKHFWMLKHNIHDNLYLQNSYNKYGEDNFVFEVLEECSMSLLIKMENYYIDLYTSNTQERGYNLAKVNEFRRNTYNNVVKKKLSIYNLTKNGNFKRFILFSPDGLFFIFNNLVDAANYLISGGYAKGKSRNIRMKLSSSMRGKKLNNGYNGSIRKTCYKHKFQIIK